MEDKKTLITQKASGKPLRAFYIEEDKIEKIYNELGFDFDNTDPENPPDFVVKVEDTHYFFTGWTFERAGKTYEFVVELDKSFSQEDIDSLLPINDDYIDYEDEDEE